jgi:putative ABC transport system permease protein
MLADFRARELQVGVGDVVSLSADRQTVIEAPVVGVFRNDRFTGQQPAALIVSMETLARIAPRATQDNELFVVARDGQRSTLGNQLRDAMAQYPTVNVRSFDQFLSDSLGFLAGILNIFVGLLLFSLLIALLGIINTLLLSVYERTRELGLLRAIGTSRVQIRRMIRGEAVVIAVLGSAVGLALGLLWARIFVAALASSGFRTFAVPWLQLGGYSALAAASAVLASVIPAWRAGRLNVLDAIATE